MPTPLIADRAKETLYKMAVLQDEFMADLGGRIPAGDVLAVNEETAIRWLTRGIAEQVEDDAPTHREVQRERQRLMAELEALKAAAPRRTRGNYSDAILRRPEVQHPEDQPMPPAAARRGRPPRRADLEGAEIVNDLTVDEDE